MKAIIYLAICFVVGYFTYNHYFKHPDPKPIAAVAAPPQAKDSYAISNVTSDWNVMANDGNLAPEVTFTITNKNDYDLTNVYIEVHFLNAKTNQDYGYENDDFSILKGSNKRETIVMNGGTKGLMLNDGTQVKAVIEMSSDNNDLKTIKTVMMPKYP